MLALVGYGTKMGLAPLHTWLPDTHSEAPSPVSALLSGVLLNWAFLAILRFLPGLRGGRRCRLRPHAPARPRVSPRSRWPAAFMVVQRDYKRLLAYSSVENMGIIAVGIGLGGAAPMVRCSTR